MNYAHLISDISCIRGRYFSYCYKHRIGGCLRSCGISNFYGTLFAVFFILFILESIKT